MQRQNERHDGRLLAFFAVMVLLVCFTFVAYALYLSYQRSVVMLGGLSPYLDERELQRGLNGLLSDNGTATYELGMTTLREAGYAKTYLSLFLHPYRTLILSVLLVMCFLVLAWKLYFNHKRRTYFKDTDAVVEWISSDKIELPGSSYTPAPILQAITTLKINLNRQRIIHEEDSARIMHYMEDISHQLKTPLTVIRTVCERSEIHIQAAAEPMKICLAEVDKMTGMIRDLLQLGRFDCNKQKAHFEPVLAHDLIETVINELDLIAWNNGVEMHLQGPGDIQWYCDVFWMKEAIGNLLKNSIEHSRDSHITITYDSGSQNNRVLIQDEGSGFSRDIEKELFERYSFRGRSSQEGDGLGLAIANEVIKMHYGSITAQNRPEGGAEFHILFPRLDPQSIYGGTAS